MAMAVVTKNSNKPTAIIKSLDKSSSEMEKVNQFTVEELSEDDVYLFKIMACDNNIDRDDERISDKSLQELAELYVGRTIIKDHVRSADNQFARVYDAQVVGIDGEQTKDGMPLKGLLLKCYTLDNEANKNIVSEIKAGIKKEVSISFSPQVVECSICGCNQFEQSCRHYWGKEYDGQTCFFTFSEVKDAYELSFVAVPAQKDAGTRKSYGGDKQADDISEEKEASEDAFLMAQTRVRISDAARKLHDMKGSV